MANDAKNLGTIAAIVGSAVVIGTSFLSAGGNGQIRTCLPDNTVCFFYDSDAVFQLRKDRFAQMIASSTPFSWPELQEMSAAVNYDIKNESPGILIMQNITNTQGIKNGIINELKN